MEQKNLVSTELGGVKNRHLERQLLVRANKNLTLLDNAVSWLCCIETS